MNDQQGQSQEADDSELIAAAESKLRRTEAAACLVRKPGEDFPIVAGPAETVFSLIEEDIEFYKHNVDVEE